MRLGRVFKRGLLVRLACGVLKTSSQNRTHQTFSHVIFKWIQSSTCSRRVWPPPPSPGSGWTIRVSSTLVKGGSMKLSYHQHRHHQFISFAWPDRLLPHAHGRPTYTPHWCVLTSASTRFDQSTEKSTRTAYLLLLPLEQDFAAIYFWLWSRRMARDEWSRHRWVSSCCPLLDL